MRGRESHSVSAAEPSSTHQRDDKAGDDGMIDAHKLLRGEIIERHEAKQSSVEDGSGLDDRSDCNAWRYN